MNWSSRQKLLEISRLLEIRYFIVYNIILWAGRLFFTIRPGRLSLPSVAYDFTSIPGWVQFPFDLSLVAVTRIRASVSTPLKLTWRGIHYREQTQPLHTPTADGCWSRLPPKSSNEDEYFTFWSVHLYLKSTS